MKYLVTGGTGFIGSALVKALVQRGDAVRVLDNNLRGRPRRLEGVLDQVDLLEADIRDADAVHRACLGMDCVVHLAYLNGTEFFYSKPDLVLDIGVKGTLNALEGAIAAQVPRFVFASSSETYQTPPMVPTPEDVPLVVPDVLNPRYSYGGGKLIGELLTINYGRAAFQKALIFRPHNVYGPDMGWEHVLPQFALRLFDLQARHPSGPLPFAIQGSGQETRAFVHINDFTQGLLLAMDKGEHLNVYHIGTEEEVSIADLARRMARVVLDRELNLLPSAAPAGATPRRCPSIAKLSALGYAPSVGLDEGLKDLANWYRENAHLQPNDKLK